MYIHLAVTCTSEELMGGAVNNTTQQRIQIAQHNFVKRLRLFVQHNSEHIEEFV